MPFENLSPKDRELALRLLLRGRRLVFEVGITRELLETCERTLCIAGRDQRRFYAELANQYPATLVVLLVAVGVFEYEPSGYWAKLGLSTNSASAVGQAFERALRRLGLATFQEMVEGENALRYLAPILAHGGIPDYCRRDFFRLLVRTVADASAEPTEILNFWRNRKSYTQGIDKPVLRFLLYGGEPAQDFLGRCVDMVLETRRAGHIPDAAEVGLSASFVEAFREFESDVRTAISRDTLPRPYVQLDPWDGLGPTLELPAGGSVEEPFVWRMRDERRTGTWSGSRARHQTVRLEPARAWDVELRADNGYTRTFVFECFNPFPVLFFDPATGRLWRNHDKIRLSSAWVLHHGDVKLTGLNAQGCEHSVRLVEELPQPAGCWSDYRLNHYDLQDLGHVVVRPSKDIYHRIPIAQPGVRPMLVEVPEVPGTQTDGGATLYPRFPRLRLPELADVGRDRWRITARSNGMTRNFTAAELQRDEQDFSLEALLQDWMLHEVDLAVRGPLGCDLTSRLAIVPGLRVERPTHVLMPHEAGQVRVVADHTVHLGALQHEGATTLCVSETMDHVHCHAAIGHDEVELRIAVPRLTWAVGRSGDLGVTPGAELLVVDAAEIGSTAGASLVVTAGAAGVRMRLSLAAGGQPLQHSEWTQSSSGGRLFFDLRRFNDTLQRSGAPNPEFVLDIGHRSVRVARVVTKIDISNISATRTALEGRVSLECRFEDARTTRNREVRLWSQDRPWEDPFVRPVPDGATGEVLADGPNVPPPGRYIVEVSLSDPWNRPVRPRKGAPNSAALTLGQPEELEEHRRTLDSGNPLHVLETALATGKPSRPLAAAEALSIAPHAVEASCCLLRDLGAKALYSRSFHYLVSLCACSPEMLGWSIGGALDRGGISPADLLRLAIAAIPLTTTTDDAEAALSVDLAAAPASPPGLTDSILRDLWSTCPPVAALIDVPRAQNENQDSIERCEEFLGVRPGSQVDPGEAMKPLEWQLPAESLRELHRAMELKPVRLLQIDALVEATFEWLLAEREGRLMSTAWCMQHQGVHHHLPVFDQEIQQHMTARRPKPVLEEGMKLSRRVLGAAMHVVASSPFMEQAAEALLPLVDVVPKLVTRDLTLAMVLVANHVAKNPPSTVEPYVEPA